MKNIFLDSGAFSALTQDSAVDIDKYIDFIKQNKQHISIYANLDVIGDANGSANEYTAQESLYNLKRMEDAGLSPLPAFHHGEPMSYLQYYVDKYNYIALGGMVGGSAADLRYWLDFCFSQIICGYNGWPKLKVHGFGLTSLSLMKRYPWYSVDSGTWTFRGKLGEILIPLLKGTKWVYDDYLWIVGFTANNSHRKTKRTGHYHNLNTKLKQNVDSYLKELGFQVGVSEFKTVSKDYVLSEWEMWANKDRTQVEVIKEPGVCNQYKQRHELNIRYFMELQKTFPPWPTQFKLRKKSCLFT